MDMGEEKICEGCPDSTSATICNSGSECNSKTHLSAPELILAMALLHKKGKEG
jgi:hypothetical protein